MKKIPFEGFAYISLGSNRGDREHFLNQAILEIQRLPEIQILKSSWVLETEPLENTNQGKFLNQILKLQVTKAFTLPSLLQTFQAIESKLGRIKRSWKGPREIDIDILSYESIVMETDFLTLPHHSLFTRPFIRELLQQMGEEELYCYFYEVLHEKYHP